MGMREIHNIIEFEVPSEDVSAALEVIGVPDEVVSRASALHASWSAGISLSLPTNPGDAVFGFAPDGISVAVSLHAHGRTSLKLTWDSLTLTNADHATKLISLAFPSTLVWMTKVSYEDALATITGVRDDQVVCSIWNQLGSEPKPGSDMGSEAVPASAPAE